METAKNKGYIKSAQIAEIWNKTANSSKENLTGDDISRKFRRILEKLEGKQQGTRLNCIYKSIGENKDKKKNDWIFFDSSKIVEINKRLDEIDALNTGGLTKYCELSKEGEKLTPEYEKYKMDVYDTVKEIFDLWEISKRGYFTSSEKDTFIEMLICLIPKEQECWNEKKQKSADVRLLKDVENRFENNKGEVQDTVNKFFMETRNSDFYMLRILREAYDYTGQYQLVRQWADKWIYLMNTACIVRRKMNEIVMPDKNEYIKRFSAKDLLDSILIWYYINLLQNNESNSGNQDHQLKKNSKELKEKDDCIFCVNEVVDCSKTIQFAEDYDFILKMAFMELEEIGSIVNDNPDKYIRNTKNQDIEDYNEAVIVKKCLKIVNPNKANIDLNYVKYFGLNYDEEI